MDLFGMAPPPSRMWRVGQRLNKPCERCGVAAAYVTVTGWSCDWCGSTDKKPVERTVREMLDDIEANHNRFDWPFVIFAAVSLGLFVTMFVLAMLFGTPV